MSTTPTVNRYRYPWRRLVPGEPHTIRLEWLDSADVSASTFEVVMVDAYTGDTVPPTYTINDDDAATGTIVATATIPDAIETTLLYELRVIQDDETIVAGPVVFAPTTIPVAAPTP